MTAEDLAALLAETPVEVLGAVVLAVAGLHQADRTGRCQWCQPKRRWWQRRSSGPCPTMRMMLAELRASRDAAPHWTPA